MDLFICDRCKKVIKKTDYYKIALIHCYEMSVNLIGTMGQTDHIINQDLCEDCANKIKEQFS